MREVDSREEGIGGTPPTHASIRLRQRHAGAALRHHSGEAGTQRMRTGVPHLACSAAIWR